MNDHIEETTTLQTLPVPLAPGEKEQAGEELAHLTTEIGVIEARKKAYSKDFNEQIDERSVRAKQLAREIEHGREEKVEVCIIKDFRANTIRKVRADTGEALEPERTMTSGEAQRGIPLGEDAPVEQADDRPANGNGSGYDPDEVPPPHPLAPDEGEEVGA